MKVDATNNKVDGTTTDESQKDAIEILSFEHSIERAPVRGNKRAIDQLAVIRQEIASLRDRSHGDGGLTPRLRSEELKTTSIALASNLELLPIVVWKMVDKSSPALNHWATDRTLLTSVTLTIRTQVMGKDKFEVKDFLKVVVKKAFISQMETSSNPLYRSPVEKIAIVYQQIEWLVKTKKAFAWDVAKKKSF